MMGIRSAEVRGDIRENNPRIPRARLVGIGKSFGSTTALASVDPDFHPGEVHAILGENGAADYAGSYSLRRAEAR